MTQEIDHLVLMGVAGSGKTTLASAVARSTGRATAEADDFHPPANIAKMQAGLPLDDADRSPWLTAIRDWMDMQRNEERATVLTCSALRRRYRDVLRSASGRVVFVHLSGAPELVARRMAARAGHFMPPTLLPSQFSTLEPLGPDEDGFSLDISAPPAELLEAVLVRLDLTSSETPAPRSTR